MLHLKSVLIRIYFRNHALLPITQILIALRFYATGSMLRVVGDFGGIDAGTASRVVKHVSIEIASLSHRYIQMPGIAELEECKSDFQDIANFPNVIGAIDCTHVRIQSPGKIIL